MLNNGFKETCSSMILDSGTIGAGVLSKPLVVLHPVIKRTYPKNIRFDDRFRYKSMNFLIV